MATCKYCNHSQTNYNIMDFNWICSKCKRYNALPKGQNLYIMLPQNPTAIKLRDLHINKALIGKSKKDAIDKFLESRKMIKISSNESYNAKRINSEIWELLLIASYPDQEIKQKKIS